MSPLRADRIGVGGSLVGALLFIGILAGPVLGVDPSPVVPPTENAISGPEKSAKPAKSPQPERSRGAAKAVKAAKERVPETPITVTGTVAATTDADGDKLYTLTAGGKTYTLEAGPAWWYGANHPLAVFVGKSVTVIGELEASTEIDVVSVDGKVIRTTTGKPPWAGGPKRVGEKHPGWKSWHAAHPDGKPGKGLGRNGHATAPGQLKKAAAAAAAASASPAP